MEAVAYCDDAIEPIHAVKSIRHRKHDNRQQEDQIEEDFAAAAFRREGESPMMAEPKHAGHDKTDHQRDETTTAPSLTLQILACAAMASASFMVKMILCADRRRDDPTHSRLRRSR